MRCIRATGRNLGCELLLVVQVFYLCATYADGMPVERKEVLLDDERFSQTLEYLERFGYLDTSKPRTSTSISNAVRKFQFMMHLPQTGKLNMATAGKMAQTRCGVPDYPDEWLLPLQDPARGRATTQEESYKRRQTLPDDFFARWWFKCDLTWNLLNGYFGLSSVRVRDMMRMQLDKWQTAINGNNGGRQPLIGFTELRNGSRTDIEFSFERRNHGDNNPFDGPGNVLAHSFFPYTSGSLQGKLHIDSAEDWSPRSPVSLLLNYVILHELGHIMGLTHSPNPDAVMFATIGLQNIFVTDLHAEDVERIQKLYPLRFCDIFGDSKTRGRRPSLIPR